MKIENQVCSFDQAALIYSYGVRLETTFWWFKHKETHENVVLSQDIYLPGDNWVEMFPAYNVAELGILLPDEIKVVCFKKIIRFYRYDFGKFVVEIVEPQQYESGYIYKEFEAETEAKVRAEILIWLLENKYLNQEDLKL